MPHFVITGPGLESTTWPFPNADVFVIGRAHTCALVLPDPGGKVSQTHAAIVRVDNPKQDYFVRDLGSRNSTRLGGQNVYQRVLLEGDRLDIADYRLIYRREEYAQTTLSRFRRLPAKRSDRGIDAETIGTHAVGGRLPADAVGTELLEQFARISERGSTLAALFDEFLPRILVYVNADRGFVSRFTCRGGRDYTEVMAFGLQRGHSVGISDDVFDKLVDRLLSGEIVSDHNTLLVPISTSDSVHGFFCLDRRDRRALALSPEHRSFLSTIGELAGPCCEPPTEGPTDERNELRVWPNGLVGCSPGMERLRTDIETAAKAKRNVRVLGETGTGKQVVADELRRLACGPCTPFIEVECGAITESLADTSFFGHEKGAFTDAKEKKQGYFVSANGGALFLDDLQRMPDIVRGKLYRVLLDKRVLPVGSSQPTAVEVFVIAGIETKPDAAEDSEIPEPAFRERFPRKIMVPPLRDRREDIPVLAFYFLDCCAVTEKRKTRSISHRALDLLIQYDWPGNVRELKNCIENAVSQNSEIILSSDLPPAVAAGGSTQPPRGFVEVPLAAREPTSLRTLAEIEKDAVDATLRATGGNVEETARILKVSPQTVRNMMTRYDLLEKYGRTKK